MNAQRTVRAVHYFKGTLATRAVCVEFFPRRQFGSSFDSGSSSSSTDPVRLAGKTKLIGAKQPSEAQHPISVLFLHGLLSSKEGWSGRLVSNLSKQLGDSDIQAEVHFLDARNHGASPWSDVHSYPAMVADVERYIETSSSGSQMKKTVVVGHSQGGKCGMLLALTKRVCAGLVVVDASPTPYGHSHDNLFHAMENLDLSQIRSKTHAVRLLTETPKLETTPGDAEQSSRLTVTDCAFAATNLVPPPKQGKEGDASANNQGWTWRCNLSVLARDHHLVTGWPADQIPPGASFEGPCTFIAGSNSGRVTSPEQQAVTKKLFPGVEFCVLEGSHFIHSEKPAESAEAIASLVRKAAAR